MVKIPGTDLRIGLKTVNPTVAKQMLSNSVRNRRLSRAAVARNAQAMAMDEWVVGEPLLFNCDGTLIDGQNRLHAVIQSKKPIDFLLIEGYQQEEVFAKINGGTARKLAHWLQIRGENLPDVLAPVIVMAAKDQRGRIPTCGVGRGFILTPVEGIEFLEAHPDLRHSVAKAPGTVNPYAPRSMLCFAHWKFSKLDKTLANEFLIELTTGENEGEGDPIYLLRDRLKSNRRAKVKLPRTEVFALIIKAWNAYRTGKKLHNLRWRSTGPKAESFPEPI
jgi:hypothetical protein